MDPLFPLGPLATNIKHAIGEGAQVENCFRNTRSLQPRSQDILIRWSVVWREEAVEVSEKASTEQLAPHL